MAALKSCTTVNFVWTRGGTESGTSRYVFAWFIPLVFTDTRRKAGYEWRGVTKAVADAKVKSLYDNATPSNAAKSDVAAGKSKWGLDGLKLTVRELKMAGTVQQPQIQWGGDKVILMGSASAVPAGAGLWNVRVEIDYKLTSVERIDGETV